MRARALSLVAFVGFLLAPASSSSALSACGWKVVPIAPHTPFSSELSGVAPISATDVWAVGFYRTNADPSGVPLAEHFDGSKWHVSSPPAQAGALVGVSRVPGTKRIWAVGWSGVADLNANQAALIERHDGRGWIVAPSPAPQNSVLLGVTAIAWNDVWAVGRIETQNGSFPWRTLIEHWDGRSWSVVPSPNAPDGTGALNAVAGVSAHDVWAVGESGGGGTPFYQFIEHWNGSSWSVVPSPTLYDTLQGVSAVSATDVWAVGSYGFLHFDGSSWSVAPDPPHISPDAVKAFTGSNAWTVGGPGGTADLIEHWNGSRWELTATNGDQYESALYGVDGLDRNDVWAVGVHDENLPLIEHRGC